MDIVLVFKLVDRFHVVFLHSAKAVDNRDKFSATLLVRRTHE